MIRGHGGGGSESSSPTPYTPVESPDSIRSKQYARIIDLLSEGEIEGLVNGNKSIKLAGTPLQNADGTYNFSNVIVNTRNGTQAQTYIEGFPSVESENGVGVRVTFASSVTRTITDPNLNYVRVTISIPQLFQQQTNGDTTGTTVQYAIDLQSNGGGFVDQAVSGTISDKTMSKYQRSHLIKLTGSAPWDIRVRRLTADSTSATLQNQTWWESYTSIIDSKFSYPNSALVGLQFDASQFQSIPERSYDVKLLKIQIPSNYNPLTRVYTGVWDGSFKTAWSDNPAWCFYDLLTDTRYGLGGYVDSTLVDKYTLYTIGQYCDELVSDGFGGTEPRFTCNLYLQTREDAYKVIANMASIFRGMVYWSTNSISAVQDSPIDVRVQFCDADVIDGLFSYSGSAKSSRHTVAHVSWNDPTDDYKQKIEYVEDSDAIARYGVIESEIVAVGCTSRGQAHRLGKWLLYTEAHETETLTFKTGLKGSDVSPGNVIQTLDSNRAGVRFGGRIVSSTAGSVTLDSSVSLTAGNTYTLSVVLPDGTIVDKTVTNAVPGTYTTLTISPVFSTQPQNYAIWILKSTDITPEKWRVLSVAEDKDIYTIVAMSYNASKYTFVEQNLSLEVPSTTLLTTTQSPVTSITISDALYYVTQDILGVKLMISWPPPSGAVRYEVSYNRVGDSSYTLQTTSPSVEILNIIEGTYEVRVIAYNVLGTPSTTTTASQVILGRNNPPSNVSNFKINVLNANTYLSWDAVTDLDLSHYQIKFSPVLTGATWASASTLVEKVGKPATSVTVPTLVGTYLIKAVDFYDNYSAAESTIVTNISQLDGFNVVSTLTESPTFAGTKTNCAVVASTLQLSSSLTGTYTFNNSLDLGAVYTSKLTSNIKAYGSNLLNTIASWTTLNSVEFLSGTTNVSGWSIDLQIRTTNTDPAGAPTWTAWKSFIIGDYSARAFQFRLLLTSTSLTVTPVIETLSVTIDMPDRVYGQNDVVCGTTGSTITYSPAFKASPHLAISAQGLQTGDYYVITSKSATGFSIIFKDSTNTAVQRTFDYVAKGYGYVI